MAEPADTTGASAPISLTPKGEAYANAHSLPVGCPPGVEPAVWRQTLADRVEAALDEATRFLAALDELDDDIEAEPTEDFEPSICASAAATPCGLDDLELDTADSEPSLGWTDMESRYDRAAPTFDPDLELDGADDEPSLGAPGAEPIASQASWARGAGDDTEQQEGDDEPDAEGEPNLGAPESSGGPSTTSGVYRGAPLAEYIDPRTSQEIWSRGLGDDDESNLGGAMYEGQHDLEGDDGGL